MNRPAMSVVVGIAVLPALVMLVGIAELVSERAKKLDRVLPRRRLLLGFGALTLGGAFGALVALIGLLVGARVAPDCDLTLFAVMLVGGLLDGGFAWLLYRGYRPREGKRR